MSVTEATAARSQNVFELRCYVVKRYKSQEEILAIDCCKIRQKYTDSPETTKDGSNGFFRIL